MQMIDPKAKSNLLYVSQQAFDQMQRIPTLDAEVVVRCAECEHWGGVVFGNVCRRWSAPLAGMKNCTKPDDFCSYGERKDGEG